MVFPNEQVLDVSISILLQVPTFYRRPLPPLRLVIHRTLTPHFVKESLLESVSVSCVSVNPSCTVGSLLTKPRYYKRIYVKDK